MRINSFTLTALACLSTLSQAQDRVFPVGDPAATGQIKEVTRDKVRITVRNKDQEYMLSEVLKITFGGEPRGLDRARDQVLQKQYDQAVEELKRIDTATLNSVPVQQDYEFYMLYSQGQLAISGNGDLRAAAAGLVAFVRKNAQTHHFYDASELIGQLAVALGQSPKPFYDPLVAAPDALNKSRGGYRLGQYHLSKGEFDEGLTAFQVVMDLKDNQENVQQLKRLCEVGAARCQLAKGQAAEALASLDAMAEKSDSTNLELFAAISNARGACCVALGQPRRAVARYLQTDTLFFTDPDAHAESLYHLSKLWGEIGEATRAVEARTRLQKQYSNSPWATKE